MTSRSRSLSRTLIAVTAAAAPVVALAPSAHAAPSPQLPRMPQPPQPAKPVVPTAPTTALPTVEQSSVTRWVSVPVANVRSGPSTSYRVVGTRTQGAAVQGVLTSNGWLKISDTQYMAPSVVSATDPGGAGTASTAGKSVTMYLSADVGNIRSGPGLGHRVVGTMTKGTVATGTWTSNGWLDLGSGRYVSGTILTASASSGATSAPQSSQAAQTVTRWVSVPVANVRRGPSTSHAVVGAKTAGAEVRGTLSTGGWLKVSETQYMAPSVVSATQPGTGSAASTSAQRVTMYLSASVGNIRSGPGLQHRVVGTMTQGTQVTGTWTSNRWLDLGNGRYVSGTILTSTSSAGTTPQAAQTVTRWVSARVANVRQGPSTNHSVVGTKTSGTEVRGTISTDGWLKISDTQYMAPTVLTSTNPGTSGSSAAQVTQYVTAAVGNVRSGPGLNHNVVGTVTLGTQVRGTWTSNQWLDLGDGRFVSGLILASSSPTAAPVVQVDRWVSVPVANVRSGPSTSHSVVGTRTQGAKVSGEIASNGWLKMSATQYMAPSVLSSSPPATNPAPTPAPTPPAPTQLRQSLLSTAAKYVGYPYVLYGTPPEAFDCSAYTWWVYQQNGINIPRTVRDQRAFVTPVTNPQPGDLVFYKNYYHVGIYAGPGMSYEAQNPSTGVIYGKIWDRDPNVWYGRVPGV